MPTTSPGMLECSSVSSIAAAASVSLAFMSSVAPLPGNASKHSVIAARDVCRRAIASMPGNVKVERHIEEPSYGIHDRGIVAVRHEPLAQWTCVENRYLCVREIVHTRGELQRREPRARARKLAQIAIKLNV